MSSHKYLLLTAAYNEELYLENTIKSVLSQTVLPVKWIIISDASTDGTDDILKRYSREYEFIFFRKRTDEHKRGHNFASKVFALNYGLKMIGSESYDYIGILDADIILPDDYYERIMKKFWENENLGVAGGIIYEKNKRNKSIKHDISLNTVIGSNQTFNIMCFKKLGDFIPMKYGGEDSIMCVIANFLGWKSQTFLDIRAFEQKYIGRAKSSLFKARIDRGKAFYDMGYHPIFFLIKCLYRIKDNPILIGSFAELYGFIYMYVKRIPRTPPAYIVQFLRRGQIDRLKRFKTFR